MKKQREFKQDFAPMNKEYEFKCGEVATIITEEIPNVVIKIKNKSYKLPYRDFIVITKRKD